MLLATVSAALLFGVAAFFILRSGRVSLGAGLVVWLSGYTAAATGIAPYVNHALTALAHLLGSIH